MYNNNLIRCSQISVDCVLNDPVDIRCGGPEYLGFDFFVNEEKAQEMIKFITLAIENFNIPLVNIYVANTYNLNHKEIWTKERIIKDIKANAEYLQSEASKNYDTFFRK